MEKEIITFEVSDREAGRRLDKFLVDRLPKTLSRTYIQKLIKESHILVSGSAAKRGHILRSGECVEVSMPKMVGPVVTPEEIPLDIVYEDGELIVINKSGEMVVHPAPGNWKGTLANALAAHCGKLSTMAGEIKPGIVHRIDKGTSGLLVSAKTDHSHRFLSRQFKNKTSKRVYVALVQGVVQLDNGIVELPIGRHVRDRKKMAVRFDRAKDAVTRYSVLERFKHATLLELTLETGRTHQIRVHMAHIGHPIVGDDKYGTRGLYPRPMLHAKLLGFTHPVTKEFLEFTSPIPKDMKAAIKKAKSDKID